MLSLPLPLQMRFVLYSCGRSNISVDHYLQDGTVFDFDQDDDDDGLALAGALAKKVSYLDIASLYGIPVGSLVDRT